jgi:hypothetical protein
MFCVAVGAHGTVGVEHYPVVLVYRHGSWEQTRLFPPLVVVHRQVRMPGLSCASDGECLAAGTYTPPGPPMSDEFSAQFHVGHWKLIFPPAPAPGAYVTVGGLSCAGSSSCVLVGGYRLPSTAYPYLLPSHPFVQTFDGTAWGAAQTLPVPAGAGGAVLNGVSCAAKGSCVAVGATTTTNGQPRHPLVERLVNGHWRTQPAPTVHAAHHPYLNAVSCRKVNACVAVGLYTATSGSFVEQYGA